MFDLNDEMRHMAADAAHNARPMAVTEVIRLGNRRRTRTIAQRSIGGLSAVGLGAAVLFTGGTHHLGSNPAASSAIKGGNTLSVSSTSALGDISMRVKYSDLPTGKVKIVSVTYSGDIKKPSKHGFVELEFGPGLATGKPANPIGIIFIGTPLRPGQHHFSGSLSGKSLGKHGLIVPGNDSIGISVQPPGVWKGSGKGSGSGDLKPAKRTLTAIGILTR
ncbi:MAG TPA: hypothetical protein VFI65_15980 [Streptosporangiaceae bacterium]|nr:hypothetical protein [Streptosporangiaceae bacterium]